MVTAHMIFNSCTDSKACSCVESLSPSDKCDTLPIWVIKRELVNQDVSAANKQKERSDNARSEIKMKYK